MQRRILLGNLVLTISFLFFLMSCVPQKEPISTAVPEEKVTSGMEKPALGWEEEWSKTLQEAKKEGRVSIYSTVGGAARDNFIQGFRDKHGLAIECVTGKGGEISQKLLTERRAGLYLVDVYVGGVTTLINEIKPSGALDPLSPALILPEVKEGKNWYGGNLLWMDKEQKIIAFTAYPTIDLALNTNLVMEGEIKYWKDLLNPKWRGKILMNDPTMAGAGLGWFARTVELLGVEYMKELAKQEPTIIRDKRLQVEWLARGKYALVVNPESDAMSDFIKAGAPIRWAREVAEGAALSSGMGQITLINKAPHPYATLTFINWLLSREGQTIYSRAILQQSAREDIPTDHLEDVREPGIKYIMQTEDFYLRRPTYAKLAQDIFGHLMK